MSKALDPNALFVHDGDFMIGDLFFNKFFGVAELRILESLGLDAIALGNHEFDLTPAVLTMALDSGLLAGRAKVLSSNLIMQGDELAGLRRHVQSSTVKSYGNLKVGLFSLITPQTNMYSLPSPAVVDTQLKESAAAQVAALRSQGCNVIVCLSHLGLNDDKAVAAAVDGIDVIVGGHDHFLLDAPVTIQGPANKTTWIVQAGAFYSHVGKLQLVVENGAISLLNAATIKLDQSVPEEPQTKAAVTALIVEIEALYGPVYSQAVASVSAEIREVARDLFSVGRHDTPFGNLVTDAFRAGFQTDIAIQPGGATAQPLYEGPIVGADVYRALSYGFNTDNTLGYHMATFNISGAALAMGLEVGLSTIELYDEFLIQVSGMKYVYDPSRPPFQRMIEATVNGAPLDPQRMYSVAANEFVALMLQALSIPISDLRFYRGDTTEFGALLPYIMQLQTLSPTIEGRIEARLPDAVRPSDTKPLLATVFPNPCTTALSLVVNDASLLDGMLTVLDLSGRSVMRLTGLRNQATNNILAVDISTLSAGKYLLVLERGLHREVALVTVTR